MLQTEGEKKRAAMYTALEDKLLNKGNKYTFNPGDALYKRLVTQAYKTGLQKDSEIVDVAVVVKVKK